MKSCSASTPTAGTSSTASRFPPAALEDQLKGMFASRTEDKVLYFRADKDLDFGKIQEAVETARQAGVRVMAAITEVKPSGKGLFEK